MAGSTRSESGTFPDAQRAGTGKAVKVAEYLLCHQHRPEECAVAFAAWKRFRSPLRGRSVMSSCMAGDHRLWWRVAAEDPDSALSMLPRFVLTRTKAVEVGDVPVP